jgi:hypothetical protein
MQSLPKSLFIFVFCVPLAIVFGVMLATPLDQTTLLMLLGGMLLLLTPLLLTNHHAVLILSWNAYVNAFFLPGKPYIWMLATAVSTGFLILTITLNRGKMQILRVPSVTLPLLALAVISYITSLLTGGVGSQSLGSEVYGGKRYAFLWAAIVGYFALSSLPVAPGKRQILSGLFFLSSSTAVISNIAYMLGDKFYFLFFLFPVEWALPQAASERAIGGFSRVGGLGPASVGIVSFMLLRYGLRGSFDLRYPWRVLILIGGVIAGLFSGFRATFLLAIILFALQFLLEGLHRTKYLMILVLGLGLVAAAVLPFANQLPLPVQRCLTLFPLDLDPVAIENARGSTMWRIEMWRVLVADIPKYFWIGKGYAIDPKDLYFSQPNIAVTMDAPYQGALVAGDYHSGLLSLIIPFGIWGVLAFTWFCAAGLRVLWRNLKYGDESIKNINAFLLVAFISRLLFFVFVFGAFYLDLSIFTGIIALSISVNRGVAVPAPAPAPVPVAVEPEPELIPAPQWQPAFRRPQRI